ncbi:hypothetical protein DV495_004837 [Geotrichum candidum]|uniref:DSBA-like thioredoxin domain-containing protein n=1 Tax=Geotrichum candidum TaxID=1173061 RepID=A0A0J9X7Z9_GEOCN|nr:hypothetical protein DV452_003338 [Geotrichum candidum]KAI9210749.1 hypothetical protein DS838_004371 [Geotrichum bryndzae]KAF5115045.1 hypothetical protein DV454_002585 [Geotrichum candidum]KAF5119135.1 hypothetical protein DV495_004837 [Geotrichum candidum]KAF7499002.1 hypothetical protein DV113_002998 [Geotrichum candidum]
MSKMIVEVWSDVMCPFCFIGKRNYEKALSQFKHASNVELVWKSFQLDPTIPTENITKSHYEFLAEKKGWTVSHCKELHKSLLVTGKKAGIDFNFDIVRDTNSFNTHRVLQLAQEKGLGNHAEEIFFKAFFQDGKNLNDRSDLFSVAKEVGLTEAETEKALTDDKYAAAVKADIREATRYGVQGVPFFVFDKKYAVSGAQEPVSFLRTLEKSYTEWKNENSENNLQSVSDGPACTPDGVCK